MDLKYLITLTALCFSFVIAEEDDEEEHTVQYNTDNFAEELPKRHHFVMFYAPWCGHCQRMKPTWEQLSEMLNDDDSEIRVAKVDCTIDHKLCSEHDVTGYPTLKFFIKGKSEGVKFRGTRDLPTLTTFINEQLREGEDADELDAIPDKPLFGLTELTEDNFESHIKDGKHFIKFYAPWCGHCQQLAPVWEELAKTYQSESDISVAKLDCTKHKSVCTELEIKSYPTLLWIEDGEKVDKYQGIRSIEDLSDYVRKMAGHKKSTAEVKGDQKDIVDGSVSELTAEDFKNIIKNGVTMVKYFAPWCGHCKRLAPTWEDLGKKFEKNKMVNIVKVDCTLEKNKDLCNEENVEGFPTIYLYKNGKKISEYRGSRSLEDLQNFITGHLGHDEL